MNKLLQVTPQMNPLLTHDHIRVTICCIQRYLRYGLVHQAGWLRSAFNLLNSRFHLCLKENTPVTVLHNIAMPWCMSNVTAVTDAGTKRWQGVRDNVPRNTQTEELRCNEWNLRSLLSPDLLTDVRCSFNTAPSLLWLYLAVSADYHADPGKKPATIVMVKTPVTSSTTWVCVRALA